MRTAKTRVGRRDVMKGVVAGVVALLVGEATPVAARRRRLKRTFRCPGPADTVLETGSGIGDRARQAQVFTASRSGSLRKIAVGLAEARNTGDYVIQLVAVTGSPNGVPSTNPADVLAQATIKDKNVPLDRKKTVVASFSGPKLVAGTEYAVVVDRLENTSLTTQVRQSQDDDGAACPNSRMFTTSGDRAFLQAKTLDLIVTVSVA